MILLYIFCLSFFKHLGQVGAQTKFGFPCRARRLPAANRTANKLAIENQPIESMSARAHPLSHYKLPQTLLSWGKSSIL